MEPITTSTNPEGTPDRVLQTETDIISLRMVELEGRLQATAARGRPMTYLFLFMGLVSLALGLFGSSLFPSSTFDKWPLMGFAIALYIAFVWAFLGITRQSRTSALRQELDVLTAKKRILDRVNASATATGQTVSYFDRLVDINLTNLGAYYGMVKIHANNSFVVATSAGAIGFALVLAGLLIGFGAPTDKTLTFVASGSGVVTEFIAGVFYYLYNRTVRQLKDYHDSLLSVQNILLSFKLVGDTQDTGQKSIMLQHMLAYLVGRTPTIQPPIANSQSQLTTIVGDP